MPRFKQPSLSVMDRDRGPGPIHEHLLASLVLLAQHDVQFAAPALVKLTEAYSCIRRGLPAGIPPITTAASDDDGAVSWTAPAVLDLFMWLTYRCFVARGSEAIPIFGPYGLVTQIGSVEYSRERRFIAKLEQWLSTIRVMWPACPARIADGRSLVIDHAIGILQ